MGLLDSIQKRINPKSYYERQKRALDSHEQIYTLALQVKAKRKVVEKLRAQFESDDTPTEAITVPERKPAPAATSKPKTPTPTASKQGNRAKKDGKR